MKKNANNKTQKKIDNQLRIALTKVCEHSLKDDTGFKWLTHQVNFSNFPASLLVTCVFETEDALAQAQNMKWTSTLQKRIQSELLKTGVRLKQLEKQVVFDTEEACKNEHNHDWALRLVKQQGRAVPHSKQP